MTDSYPEDLVGKVDEMLDDDVAELDIHDGSHGLFLAAQERRAEADAQICLRHQISVALSGDADQMLDQ